ncbi:uncharacterized protein FOMMEDRAFT_149402 [Fomitiporia mediterranea MF3/22]|uniref:uncharacterized protein n=1 Tax=Fomitiporia mediterranea (strain MF3/22) TaxID=694068 RepID=UPI0004408B7D|nr:uncharacterized protein FOMMEDRAFT_149402 [Fomitiporia mediterranea MF3/22]EJC97932.1 hypothetical protein FOMMEDRAFT_149402 [Fomitiporia mediterranea MF3/22]
MSSVSSSSTSSVLSTAASSLTSLALANSTALIQPTSDFFTNSFPQTASFGAASTSSASNNDDDGNNNNNNNTLAASSSLYLFTFLATLLLLLAISCAIVIRSFIIRRRFHRRVQEALADGSVLPPHAPGPGGFGGIGGGRRRDFGEKPKLWDAHLRPPAPLSSSLSSELRWENIKPVSARILSDKLSGAGKRRVTSSTTTPPRTGGFLQTASLGLVNGHGRSWRPRFLPRPGPPQSPSAMTTPPAQPPTISAPIPPSTSTSSSPSSPAEQRAESNSEDAHLQIHVLIAMPSPYRPRSWLSSSSSSQSSSSTNVDASPLKGKTRTPYPTVYDNEDEEEELPDVAFGVTEVPWKVALPNSPAAQSQNPSQNRGESGFSNGGAGNVGGEPSRGHV